MYLVQGALSEKSPAAGLGIPGQHAALAARTPIGAWCLPQSGEGCGDHEGHEAEKADADGP